MSLRGKIAGFFLAAMSAGVIALAADISPETVFLRANEAYRQERFTEAIEGYRTVIGQGIENGVLYYNLGNALIKTSQKGEALWAYLKARALLPHDADLAANLEYVQSLLASGTEASIKPPRVIRWLTLHGRLTTSELAWWFCGLLWLTAACWVINAWLPFVRAFLRPCAWLASLVTGLSLMALVVQTVWIEAVPRAVVTTDRVEVKFAPQATGTTHFTLSEGTIVRLLGREFGWAQVKRADGRTGWVQDDSLKTL